MNLLTAIEHHGYTATAAVMLLGSCGLPMPLSVVLLTAGAAAHGGTLSLGLVILAAFIAAMIGDTLMFHGGRYTGWWLLAGLCKVSMNPDTCIFGSARSFMSAARGRCCSPSSFPVLRRWPRRSPAA